MAPKAAQVIAIGLLKVAAAAKVPTAASVLPSKNWPTAMTVTELR